MQRIFCAVKKSYRFSGPQPGFHQPNSPWPGIIRLFPACSLVSDIPASDRKNDNLFLQCAGLLVPPWIKGSPQCPLYPREWSSTLQILRPENHAPYLYLLKTIELRPGLLLISRTMLTLFYLVLEHLSCLSLVTESHNTSERPLLTFEILNENLSSLRIYYPVSISLNL